MIPEKLIILEAKPANLLRKLKTSSNIIHDGEHTFLPLEIETTRIGMKNLNSDSTMTVWHKIQRFKRNWLRE